MDPISDENMRNNSNLSSGPDKNSSMVRTESDISYLVKPIPRSNSNRFHVDAVPDPTLPYVSPNMTSSQESGSPTLEFYPDSQIGETRWDFPQTSDCTGTRGALKSRHSKGTSGLIGNFFSRRRHNDDESGVSPNPVALLKIQQGRPSSDPHVVTSSRSFENEAFKGDDGRSMRQTRSLRKQECLDSPSSSDSGVRSNVVVAARDRRVRGSDSSTDSFPSAPDAAVSVGSDLSQRAYQDAEQSFTLADGRPIVTGAAATAARDNGGAIVAGLVDGGRGPTVVAHTNGGGVLDRVRRAMGVKPTGRNSQDGIGPLARGSLDHDKSEGPGHTRVLNKKISTYETLPCVDHYKNAMSMVRSKRRPSLSQLHEGPLEGPLEFEESLEDGDKVYSKSIQPNGTKNADSASAFVQEMERGISPGPKFGWIKGVMLRCILNIWGVMLFLRLSWIVGQAGIGFSTLIVTLSVVVTSITSMSMSAICTNGEVKGGGAYYMISRSLGPEFGGAIGMVFSVASTVAVSMNVVGLAETVVDLLDKHAGHMLIIISPANWIRIVGCATAVLLLVVVIAGMEWEAKAQVGFLLLLILAFFNYFLGTVVPIPQAKVAKGLLGYRRALFLENFFPAFQKGANFFSIFAIYFPSATGILAGANISGDLKDAQKSIPKGTFGAILVTATSYIFMIWTFGSVMLREASGDIADLYYSYDSPSISTMSTTPFGNASTTLAGILVSAATEAINPGERLSMDQLESPTSPLRSCGQTKSCKYGLLYDYQAAEMISYIGPIITAGIFSATLSSALACLVGASKVFQALCRDRLFPKLEILAVGSKKNDEPIRIYVLSFTIAVLFILIGDLNIIAPIISNFYLMAYALINYSCFDASLSKSLGFRPGFKYFNPWVSLFGGLLCIISMFLIKWWATVITFIFIFGLYAYIRYKKPDVNWGSSTQAHVYRNALTFVYKLNQTEEHVKNFRPQILALTGDPRSRPAFLDFANLFTKNLSLLICGHVIINRPSDCLLSLSNPMIYKYFQQRRIKALYNPIVAPNMREGVRGLLQLSGLGRLRPNIILMGYKHEWRVQSFDSVVDYFNIIHDAFDLRLCVGILRMPSGLYIPTVTNYEAPHSESSPSKGSTDMDGGTTRKSSKIVIEKNRLKPKLLSIGKNRNLLGKKKVKITGDNPDSSNISKDSKGTITSAKRKISRSLHTYKLSRNPQTYYANYFHGRQKKGTIDVWWLFDDGGLTILLPYILSQRRNWQNCKVRFFALSKDSKELDVIHHNFAAMLTKFRIDYSDVFVIPDIQKLPYPISQNAFEKMVQPYRVTDENDPKYKPGMVTDAEYVSLELKTFRHIRLQELLAKHSSDANLIVITLPIPRKGTCSAGLYMSWLEIMTKDLPPIMMLRGNQQSVLTFYS